MLEKAFWSIFGVCVVSFCFLRFSPLACSPTVGVGVGPNSLNLELGFNSNPKLRAVRSDSGTRWS